MVSSLTAATLAFQQRNPLAVSRILSFCVSFHFISNACMRLSVSAGRVQLPHLYRRMNT